MTSNIFDALAKLSELRSISRCDGYFEPFRRTSPFQPNLAEGAFPELRELFLDLALEDATKLLTRNFAPIYLTRLLLASSSDSETPEAFSWCLRTLAVYCKSLVSLEFDLPFARPGDVMDTSISHRHLKILQNLPNLTDFKLSHPHPLLLTNEELDDVVSSWSSLKSLRLNSNPTSSFRSGLTLTCLFSLARHCPNLMELELYIDATIPVPIPATFQTLTDLKELNVGISPIEDAHAVSIFLQYFCSINCSLFLMRDHSDRYNTPQDMIEKLKRFESLWMQVALLPPFT